MPIRKKNGRPVTTVVPQLAHEGRRPRARPAIHERLQNDDPRRRLRRALLERLALLEARSLGLEPHASQRAVRGRIERARAALKNDPNGRAAAQIEIDALLPSCASIVRIAIRSGLPAQRAVWAAADRFGDLVHEHGIDGTAALDHLLRACLWGAVADQLLARAIEGGCVEQQLRAAERATSAARLELLAAFEAQRRADEARPRILPNHLLSILPMPPMPTQNVFTPESASAPEAEPALQGTRECDPERNVVVAAPATSPAATLTAPSSPAPHVDLVTGCMTDRRTWRERLADEQAASERARKPRPLRWTGHQWVAAQPPDGGGQ